MARIDRIKRRLDNWALWKARDMSRGLGWPKQNMLARMGESVFGRTSLDGARIPHIDEDAEEINQAVESMKVGKGHLYVTLDSIYLKDWGVTETARRMGKSPSTIHANLAAADWYIDAWLQEQARIRDEKAAHARGREYAAGKSFTT